MSTLEAMLAGDLPWPDLFPRRLSPSSIALAASCPEKWRRKYVHGERDSWGGAAITGLAVHRAIEENFRQKIDSRTDLPRDDMRELAAVAFEDKVVEAEKDGIEWGDVNRGEAKDLAVTLTDAYHVDAAPGVQPVAVEEWVGLAPRAGMPELTGRVDILTDTGIVDVKTTGRKTTAPRGRTTGRKMMAPRGDWRLKGMVYVLMTGQPVQWHVVTKTKVPGIYTPATEPGLVLPASEMVRRVTERRVQTIAATLTGMLERYGPDDQWPTNATEHDWSCAYCGFRPSCGWWVG